MITHKQLSLAEGFEVCHTVMQPPLLLVPRQGHGFFKGQGYYDIVLNFIPGKNWVPAR